MSEVYYLRQKVSSLEAEKQLHIEHHAKEKNRLLREVTELKRKLRDKDRTHKQELDAASQKTSLLETELERVKTLSLQKIQHYKQKVSKLEEVLTAAAKHKSPRRGHRTTPVPRSHSRSALQTERKYNPDDICKMVVSLEAAKADQMQQYTHLLASDSPPAVEVERLSQLLKRTEFRLREAKQLQEHMIRTDFKV